MAQRKAVLGIFFLVSLLGSTMAGASTESQYWGYWDRSNERNREIIDHGSWNSILAHYVVNKEGGANRFRYGALSSADQKALKNYIRTLEDTDPRSYRRDEQQAYWLNLYNALTVKIISDNYPVKTFADIRAKNLSGDPWSSPVVTVSEQPLSLNDIENRILRPIWKDHKVHFGLNCTDMSCPGLLPQAFTGNNVKALLKKSGKDFINSQNGVTLKNGKLTASSLFNQYRSDFARDDKALLKFFAHYADDRLALYILGFQGKIDFVHDRSLNSI
ncbi:DUF547 domain-containing protein [Porticoccus sp.]